MDLIGPCLRAAPSPVLPVLLVVPKTCVFPQVPENVYWMRGVGISLGFLFFSAQKIAIFSSLGTVALTHIFCRFADRSVGCFVKAHTPYVSCGGREKEAVSDVCCFQRLCSRTSLISRTPLPRLCTAVPGYDYGEVLCSRNTINMLASQTELK